MVKIAVIYNGNWLENVVEMHIKQRFETEGHLLTGTKSVTRSGLTLRALQAQLPLNTRGADTRCRVAVLEYFECRYW